MKTHVVEDGDWIAVQTYCGREQSVGAALGQRGYQYFVPLCTERRTRRGREEAIERGLFPGYVFCSYLRCPKHRIVDIPAVVRLVGASTGPLKIEDEEIENIRILVNSGLYSEPWKFLVPGEPVVVSRGALRGARGVLVTAKKGMRLVVSVAILGRAVAVEVDALDVAPLMTPAVQLERIEETKRARHSTPAQAHAAWAG